MGPDEGDAAQQGRLHPDAPLTADERLAFAAAIETEVSPVQTDQSFRYQLVPHGHEVVVKLAGECDFVVVEPLRDAMSAALAARPGRLVLDLGEVSFLDTAAARTLVAARRDARASAVPVTVQGTAPVPQKVLEIVGMFA